jgi:hypothetical protein
MSLTTSQVFVPVVAVPPKPPQLSLFASSVAPSVETNTFELNGEQMTLLPSELETELKARQGAMWTRGFTYAPENFSEAVVRNPGDVTTVDDTFVPENLPIVYVQPYLVCTKYTCSPFGWEAIDYKGRAQRQNDLATPGALAYEFWSGTLAQANDWPNNYLENITTYGPNTGNCTPGATSATNGTAVSVIEGLGILQDALAEVGFGGQGMIHLIPRAAPSLINVRRVGKFMLDEFDNIIVPDNSYPGTGPQGTVPDAGTTWMYATDLVCTRIEPESTVFPDSFAEAMDWGQNGYPNTITFRAERFACAYWDGARHFACLVNLPT